jgi:hypothetical protein
VWSNDCPNRRLAIKNLDNRERIRVNALLIESPVEAFLLLAPRYPINPDPPVAVAPYSTVVKRGVKYQASKPPVKKPSHGLASTNSYVSARQRSPESLDELHEKVTSMVNRAVAESVTNAVSEVVSSMKSAVESMMAGVMSTLERLGEMQHKLAGTIQSIQAQQLLLQESIPQYQPPPQSSSVSIDEMHNNRADNTQPIQAQQQLPPESTPQCQPPTQFLELVNENQRKLETTMQSIRANQQHIADSLPHFQSPPQYGVYPTLNVPFYPPQIPQQMASAQAHWDRPPSAPPHAQPHF